MTDKRNIVIKVSYQGSEKATENVAPKMITEWNVKRILLAAGALVLILVVLFYVINASTQKTDVDNAAVMVNAIEKQEAPQPDVKEGEIKATELSRQAVAKTNSPDKSKKESHKKSKQAVDIAAKEIIKKQPAEKVIKERGYSKVNPNVPRALLTYEINNKEPAGEIVRAVDASRKKPVWVYYFTELKALKGSKIYHEWLKDDVVVSRQAMNISGDTWRTSSRKLLSGAEKGNWTVRLVDKNGQLLNERNFKVE